MQSYGQITFDKKLSLNEELAITGANSDNLLLWNLRIGGAVTVSDSGERLFRARLTAQGKTSSTLLVFEDTGFKKNNIRVTLLQALPEKERMEVIIQKTTELGVHRIIPFKSEKSASIETRDLKQRKSIRWQDVALKAAKQSRRPDIPEIISNADIPSTATPPFIKGLGSRCCAKRNATGSGGILDFREALTLAEKNELKIMLKQGSGVMSLKEFLKNIPPLAKEKNEATLLVGPEGGLSEEEVKEAEKAGFIGVSLGSNILRTETAAIIGAGIVRYELGA